MSCPYNSFNCKRDDYEKCLAHTEAYYNAVTDWMSTTDEGKVYSERYSFPHPAYDAYRCKMLRGYTFLIKPGEKL